MHGANRLGGNGVANSTVFGGIAGDVDARNGSRQSGLSRAPDEDAIEAEVRRAPHAVQQQARRHQPAARDLCST